MVQGSGIDASINEEGRKQAQAFFEFYQSVPFDKIYISALKRTRQSVQGFIDQGIPYESLPELNEISWGVNEGVAFADSDQNYYQDMVKKWQNGETDIKVEGGESPLDVQIRQEKAIKYILSQPDEETILICMHGRAMRILLCWLQNQPLSQMDNYLHNNLCLYKLDYNGADFKVETFNDIAHLVD